MKDPDIIGRTIGGADIYLAGYGGKKHATSETAAEHVRNAMQLLSVRAVPDYFPAGSPLVILWGADVDAALNRLRAALEQMEP